MTKKPKSTLSVEDARAVIEKAALGDIPAMFRIPQDERNAEWQKNPPKTMPYFDAPERPEDPSVTRYKVEQEAQAASQARSSRAGTDSAPRAERVPRTPRVSREGMLSVADLAKEYDMLPREARAALRAAKVPKPPQGWAFSPGSDLEKQIRAALASPPLKTVRRSRGERMAIRRVKAQPIPGDATWSGSKKDKAKWAKQRSISSQQSTESESSKPSSPKPSKSSTKKTAPKAARTVSTRSASGSSKSKAKSHASARR